MGLPSFHAEPGSSKLLPKNQIFHVHPFYQLNQGTFIFGCIMSLAALAQEKFWENKAQCEDAEKAYYSMLSGAKVDKSEANAGGAGASADVLKKLKDLELENKDLKKVTSDLKAMVLKLEGRVAAIEKAKPAAAAAAPAKAAPAPAADDEDDDDVDLFGSESEEEESEEAAKVREERLAAYAAKKAKKPALIAKTSVLLDCKPWDDETDMDVMLKEIKKIEMDGLVWGATNLSLLDMVLANSR